jgi:hypothetical protein
MLWQALADDDIMLHALLTREDLDRATPDETVPDL